LLPPAPDAPLARRAFSPESPSSSISALAESLLLTGKLVCASGNSAPVGAVEDAEYAVSVRPLCITLELSAAERCEPLPARLLMLVGGREGRTIDTARELAVLGPAALARWSWV
jgi:hypothetical protein